MSSTQDVWNEVDRRIEAAFAARGGGGSGDDSSDAPSSPPPSAGGLPIHNNLHHEPDLAIASDLTAHIGTIASAGTLGHIRIGSGLSIDGSGVVSVSSAPATSFLALTDTPDSYISQATKVVRVNAGETGLEFHTLTASDVGALTQAVADTLYDELGAASDAIADHVNVVLNPDPHPQYLTAAEGDALFLTPAEGNATYVALSSVSAFGATLIDDVNAAAARATLELNAGGTGDIWVEKAGDTMTGTLIVPVVEVTSTAVGTNPVMDFRDADFSGNPYGSLFTPAIAGNTLGRLAPFGTGGFLFNGFAAGTTADVPLSFFGYATTSGTVTTPGVLITAWKSGGGTSRVALSGDEIVLQVQTGLSTSYATVAAPLSVLAKGYVGIGIAIPEQRLDIADATGAVARLRRVDTAISANDMIGRVEFYGGDSDLNTQNIFGNIEVQALAAIGSDAASGKMLFRTTGLGTGTSPVERLALGGVKTLTDAATNLFDVTLNSGQMAGGTIVWTIIASNGTDHQAYSGIVTYAVVNKAGTYTSQITHDAANDSKAVSSGTLTAAWAVLNGTNKVTIRVTPTGSLTETTYQILYSVHSNSPQTITIL